MKLNKELAKKGLKSQLVGIKHMFVFNIISFIIFWISYIGMKPIGSTFGGGFMITEYKVNLFFVIASWIMFLISFSIFYTKYFRKDLKKQFGIHWLFSIVFIMVSLIFCVIEFILFLIPIIINVGILGSVINFPEFIYVIVMVYIIIYIIIDLIRERINKTKDKNAAKNLNLKDNI